MDRLSELNASLAGHFRIERELGAGGMAIVYLARDLKHDRAVALKVLRPEIAHSIGAERFSREIGLAAQLNHPNIVPVFDSTTVSIDGEMIAAYAMPLIEGETLRAKLNRERQLPLADVVRILRDVAAALDHAHQHGIVHRDVKPENILLSGDQALLADFGIARAAQPDSASAPRLTHTGIAVGTPAYMSPEQAAGDRDIDGRTDVYSLAVVAYELLAGATPFTGATPQAILARQITGEVLSLVPVRPSVATTEMDAVFRRALSPAPADRLPSAAAFVDALERSTHERAAGTPSPRQGATRRTLVAGAALVLVAGIAWWQTRESPAKDARLGVGVMPFRDQGGATELGEALPDLLSTFLDGTPGVRVADPWALWRPLRVSSDAPARSPDPGEAERLARNAGVRRFVLGGIVRTAARLDVTLRIYGVGVSEPISTFTVTGSSDSTASLAQRTAVEVLQRVWEGSEAPGVPRMEGVLTQSPDALKAYLAAREAMRRGMIDSANSAITRAITIDSTFSLGLLEAVLVRSWVQYGTGQVFSGLRELGLRALAHGDSLSERQRLRLRGTLAQIETDGVAAANAWQQILQRDSTDLEALRGLTYTQAVYGWQYGIDPEEVRRVAELSVRADSGNVVGVATRAMIALAMRDTTDIGQQLAR